MAELSRSTSTRKREVSKPAPRSPDAEEARRHEEATEAQDWIFENFPGAPSDETAFAYHYAMMRRRGSMNYGMSPRTVEAKEKAALAEGRLIWWERYAPLRHFEAWLAAKVAREGAEFAERNDLVTSRLRGYHRDPLGSNS